MKRYYNIKNYTNYILNYKLYYKIKLKSHLLFLNLLALVTRFIGESAGINGGFGTELIFWPVIFLPDILLLFFVLVNKLKFGIRSEISFPFVISTAKI